MKPWLLVLFCLISFATRAQIIAPDTVCQYDTVTLSTTYDAETYTWSDSTFSVDQYYNTTAINIGPLQSVYQNSLINDNGHWYEISVDYSSKLLRADMGTNPTTYPVYSTITASGVFGVSTVRDDATGNWYSFGGGYKAIFRYSYGTSLGNTPTVDVIPVPALYANTGFLNVAKYGNEWIGFMQSGAQLMRMDIGTDITNTPGFSQITIPSLLGMQLMQVMEENGNYYLFLTVNTALGANSNLWRLSLGTDIQNNVPVTTDISDRTVMDNIITLNFLKDCSKVIAVGFNANTAEIVNIDFGSSVANMPVYTVLGNRQNLGPVTSFTYNDTFYLRYQDFAGLMLWPGLYYASTSTTVYHIPAIKYVFRDTGLHTLSLYCNEGDDNNTAAFCKQVYVKPNILGTLTSTRDTGICPGKTALLDASGYGGTSYLWSTGATTPSIAIGSIGAYWVKISGAPMCANGTDTIKIKGYPAAYNNLGADTSACADSLATLQVIGFPGFGVSYLWSTSATTPSVQVPAGQDYWLQVTSSDGCVEWDTITVAIAPQPVISLADTALCPGDIISIHANAQPAGSTYLWNTGSTNDNTPVTSGSDYWLQVTNSYACVTRDTVTIGTRPLPNATLGADYSICAGKSTILQAPDSSNYTYLWNTGSNTPNAEATPGNDYWVMATDEYGCMNSDTITIGIFELPIVNLGDDAGLCAEGKVLASPLKGKYLWSTGETTEAIRVYADNTYSLAVTDKNGCTGSDDISFTAVPVPEVDLGATDTTICNDRTLILPLYANNGNKYLWSDGSTEPTLSAYQEGVYTLTYSNQCYTVADTIMIRHRNCSLWFPGAFTPNGDGKNDIARILGDLAYVSKYRLSIYNRWGRPVYSTNDMYSGWDGTHKGTQQDAGTYNYIIQYTYKDHPQKLDGAITLIR